jgi:hypothetical protein
MFRLALCMSAAIAILYVSRIRAEISLAWRPRRHSPHAHPTPSRADRQRSILAGCHLRSHIRWLLQVMHRPKPVQGQSRKQIRAR